MACRRMRRHQIFASLTQEQKDITVRVYHGGVKIDDIPRDILLRLLAFRYIDVNTKTGAVSIILEGTIAAKVILAES
jgi:hypothetical protein